MLKRVIHVLAIRVKMGALAILLPQNLPLFVHALKIILEFIVKIKLSVVIQMHAFMKDNVLTMNEMVIPANVLWGFLESAVIMVEV